MYKKERRRALILGITGQDGGYLAELLLEKGYEVHGLIRRSSSMCNRKWIDGLDIILHYGDLTDYSSLERIILKIIPHEIYNLGGLTHVGISFDNPITTFQINTLGVLNLLEIIRQNFEPIQIKMYQASTSEMLAESYGFEGSTEKTLFGVHSPYAVSKLSAHYLCQIYRNAYNLFISCGILYNHSSPRRGDNFILQKIVKGLINMRYGDHSDFEIGNIESCRDFGFAGDYVEAMYLMLQQENADDFIIATNEIYSIEDVVYEVSQQLGLRAEIGKDDNYFLIYHNKYENQIIGMININEKYKRPWDVQYLRGDYSKAKRELGWQPKIKFKELIKIMIEEELKRYEKTKNI